MMDRVTYLVTNNLGTKLVSIAIAGVLWGIVLGSRTVEVTKEIPLELITSSDVVAANDVPDHVAFRLAGPKAFLRGVLDRREDPIRVNLSGTKPGLVTYRFFSDTIRVPIGVKVLSINPTAILIKLESIKRKEVPVRLVLRGAPPEGFRIVRSEVRPPSVKIRGPESKVDSVTEIASAAVDVSDLYKDMEREVALDIARAGVQLEGSLPRAFVEVEPSSANYRLKNVDIHVLTSYNAVLGEKSVSVLVRAAPRDLKSMDRSQVYAVVDLRGKPKGEYDVPVNVTLPENLGLVKVVPERVKVTLK